MDIAVTYYHHLFTSSNPDNLEEVLAEIPQKVTEEMNEALTSPFTAEEVEKALKLLEPVKPPGPNAMPPLFFQSYWSLVGLDVKEAILMYLNSGMLPKSLRHSFITLIPKVKNPEHISQYCPISLSNVLYRVFSKVLANILKPFLPQLVSEHQSTFISNRLISDNVLVAFGTLNYMRNHCTGKTSFMALKLDMSKAYNRVEWRYMEKVLVKMGFCDKWVKLMMECIKTAPYSILISGEPHGNIVPSRGLRQGDPLLLYLFLFCTEGLHGLITKVANDGDIQGVSICKNGPKLTHLLFVDDSLVFCRSTKAECHKLLHVLYTYESASGQQVNRAKTNLFFSKSTTPNMQILIKNALGVEVVQQYEKYLGLPSFLGKNKKTSFDKIKQRIWKKLQGWEGKLLSQGGREILIKAVAQALPTYTMSCFKLPLGLCHDIESLIRHFFGGQRGNNRKVNWIKWQELCKPKAQGGLCFKELLRFNDALLAKQTWRLLDEPDSLFYKVFKAKYFPNSSVMEAKIPSSASYAWKSIIKGREVIRRGAIWRIGRGESIRVWGDNWLLGTDTNKVLSPCWHGAGNFTVSLFIDQTNCRWREDLLDYYLMDFEAAKVKAIPLPKT